MKKYLLLASFCMMPALAFAAGTASPSPALVAFATDIYEYVTGALGFGLATTMLLMGGAIGVAKCSPMPTLTGVAGAAALNWGPAIAMAMLGIPLPSHDKPADKPVIAQVAPAAVAPVTAAPVTVAAKSDAVTPQPVAQKPAAVALPHTVPVPAATDVHKVELKAAPTHMTTWLAVGGSVIILSLLGLMGFASAKRKAAGSAASGLTAGTSATRSKSSAFSDPHGFTRSAPLPSFQAE
jgi:conjugal transfer pilus assembly protein TraA